MDGNFCVFHIDYRFRCKQLITFYVDEIYSYLWIWPDIIIDVATARVVIVVVDYCINFWSIYILANIIYTNEIAVKI